MGDNYVDKHRNAKDNTIIGNVGDNTLDGGLGADTLIGAAGQDTYHFKVGDGLDKIIDADTNSIVVLEDVVFEQLHYQDGILYYSSNQDGINVELNKIAQWVIAGKTYTTEQLQQKLQSTEVVYSDTVLKDTILGPDVIEAIIQTPFGTKVTGNDKDNIIIGNDGNDTLDGGLGNDKLIGGKGDDTYFVNTLEDSITDSEGNNIVYIQSSNGFNVGRDNNITSIYVNKTSGLVTGTNGANTISADDYGSNIQGFGGDDAIWATGGKNILDGGEGNDRLTIFNSTNSTLIGGPGIDTFDLQGATNTIINDKDGIIELDSDIVYIPWDNHGITNAGNLSFVASQGEFIKKEGITSYYNFTNNNYRFGKFIYDDSAKILSYQVDKEGYAYSSFNGFQGELNYFILANTDINNINDIQNLKINLSSTAFHAVGNYNDITEFNATIFSLKDFISQGVLETHFTNNADIIHNFSKDGKRTEVIYAKDGDDEIIFEGNEQYYDYRGNSKIYAGQGNDKIYSTSPNTYLEIYGDEGDDTINAIKGKLFGGLGNDSITLNMGDVEGNEGNDIIILESGNADGNEGDDIITINKGIAKGGIGNDTITAQNGNVTLDGGEGDDKLIGGNGDDVFIVDELDTYIEEGKDLEGGYDTIQIAKDFDLSQNNFEAVTLLGSNNFNVQGDQFDNIITGNSGNNRLIGAEGNDSLTGNEGNDYLDGGTGSDNMAGGAGDDYYVVDKYETLIKSPDGTTTYIRGDQISDETSGNDTVEQWDDHRFYRQDSTGNWIDTGSYHFLQNNIENLILRGQATTAFGNELDNTITLNAQNNFVNTLGGNDTIIYQKGGGQDTIVSTDSITAQDTLVIQGYDLSNAIFTRLDNIASNHGMLQIRFAGTNDSITFNNYFAPANSDNTDNKIDQIIFDNNGQQAVLSQADIESKIINQANNHAPTVPDQTIGNINISQGQSVNYTFPKDLIIDQDAWDKDLSYSLSSLPEWLKFDSKTMTLTGTPPEGYTGSIQTTLWGADIFGSANGKYFNINILPPNQAPIVANAIADQTASFGAAFSYNMPTTTFKDPEGDALSYTATLEDGSALPTWLVFNPTTRTFSGTAPQTSSSINVKVTATDTFKNSVSDVFTINFAAPNLTINGTANADTLTGKEGNDTLNGLAGNDTLIGGAGNDKLDGGTGADKMTGGTGNDTYIVDNTGDVITENTNEGIDTVLSSITYTLGSNVENLTLTGATAINGTGNALDNILIGNTATNTLTGGAGNDTLDGGAGADKLIGGTGNDTYVVDNTGDIITENANEGTDTVQSSITYTLGNNLENLTLTGNATINGTGNTLNNTIIGNYAANTLTGGAGDDTLDGGLGNDTLIGGAGNDTYIYRANQGIDSIDNAGGGTDTINFADSNDSQLSYHKDGNDLVILVDKDLGQQVRVKNHFVTTADNAIDTITTKNGISLTSAMIATKLTALPTANPMSGDNILKDTLGNDTLAGEAGNDTYYHTGGKDVIVDTAGVDKLIFGNGITYNQVGSGLLQSGNDLILKVNGDSNNSVTLTNFFKDANSIIETISFETGGSITAQEIYSLFGKTMPQPTTPVVTAPAIQGDANNNDLVGKSSDDTLQGLAGNDRLQGLAGNDKLEGGAGNDILVGGSGNDILTGGTGNDLYYFKAGFGQDTIVNTGGGVDNIYFDGLTFNQLSQGLMKSGNDLTLKVSGSTDQLTIKDFFLGGENAGVNINFASGGSLTSDQIFGVYGQTNPNPSKNTASDYQSSLSYMLNLMSDYNKLSPLANESTVL